MKNIIRVIKINGFSDMSERNTEGSFEILKLKLSVQYQELRLGSPAMK